MSDRQIAKNRFHKGLTASLREYLRRFGLSLDEEMAQFALGGVQPFMGVPSEALLQGVNEILTSRRDVMRRWEEEHPKRNPFPPSFPERVLRLVNQALGEAYADGGAPEVPLTLIKDMCEKELDTIPVSATDEEL